MPSHTASPFAPVFKEPAKFPKVLTIASTGANAAVKPTLVVPLIVFHKLYGTPKRFFLKLAFASSWAFKTVCFSLSAFVCLSISAKVSVSLLCPRAPVLYNPETTPGERLGLDEIVFLNSSPCGPLRTSACCCMSM